MRDVTARERRTSVLLFVATIASVYLVYGYQWAGGDPLTDPEVALASAKFSVALMAILLAHEMAHYVVARRHGFALSLPYFLPFPAAFGTFGAIIRLRSLPKTRTGLLEMGAAGPLAGFVVAAFALALGLPGTVEQIVPQVQVPAIPAIPPEPNAIDVAFDWLAGQPPLSWVMPEVVPNAVHLMILANPPLMDVLGTWILGAPPGRFAELDPLATAGWVGCLLTAINLIPIGQLDGGHIFNALWPRRAVLVSRVCIVLAVLGGIAWLGWAFWGFLLLMMGAWASLPVPQEPGPSLRARWVAVAALFAFGLTFMPRPVEVESLSIEDVTLVGEGAEALKESLEAQGILSD